MANRYLEKVARILSDDSKKELAQTGVIGAIGMGTSALTHKVMNPGVKSVAQKVGSGAVSTIAHAARPSLGLLGKAKGILQGIKSSPTTKAALIGGGLGLLGDFAAVKINKAIDKHGAN
jgi:hypothetical protein